MTAENGALGCGHVGTARGNLAAERMRAGGEERKVRKGAFLTWKGMMVERFCANQPCATSSRAFAIRACSTNVREGVSVRGSER
eukprot:155-Rhodomonas_salina.1